MLVHRKKALTQAKRARDIGGHHLALAGAGIEKHGLTCAQAGHAAIDGSVQSGGIVRCGVCCGHGIDQVRVDGEVQMKIQVFRASMLCGRGIERSKAAHSGRVHMQVTSRADQQAETQAPSASANRASSACRAVRSRASSASNSCKRKPAAIWRRTSSL